MRCPFGCEILRRKLVTNLFLTVSASYGWDLGFVLEMGKLEFAKLKFGDLSSKITFFIISILPNINFTK